VVGIHRLKTGSSKAKGGASRARGPRVGTSGAASWPARALPVLDAADALARLGWQQAITGTIQGLGYDLVDAERAGRGLLRVTIDRIPGRVYGTPGAPDAGEFITVEDCEAVTRQLQYALEVEGLEYARLEVSSPGLDRPLRHDADYRRFAGQAVKVTLREPAPSNGFVNGHKMLHHRVMPSMVPGAGLSLNQLATMGGVDLDLGQPWIGDAELTLHDSPWDQPASLLPVDEIIAGYYCEVGTTFHGGTLLADNSAAI
jgi:ribosome maturation factor RimP